MQYKPTHALVSSKKHWNHPRYDKCVGHWLLNEGGGIVAYDVSGNRSHATLVSAPPWVNGQFGPALSFDGTADYATVSPTITLAGNVTYAMWVKPVTSTYRTCLGPNINDTGVAINTTNNVVGVDTTDRIVSIGTVPNGSWSHIAVTWDGTTASVYINGRLDNTSANQIRFNVVLLGTDRSVVLDETFEGAMDDIRVYARCLGGGEIQSLYLDPFLEFRPVPGVRRLRSIAAAGPPAGSLALLGVGR